MKKLSLLFFIIALAVHANEDSSQSNSPHKRLLAVVDSQIERIKKGEYRHFASVVSSIDIFSKMETTSIVKYRKAVKDILGDRIVDLETAALSCLKVGDARHYPEAVLVLGKVCATEKAVAQIKELSFASNSYLQFRCFVALTYLKVPGSGEVLTAMILSKRYQPVLSAEAIRALRMVGYKGYKATALKVVKDLSSDPAIVAEALISVRDHETYLDILASWLSRDYPDSDDMNIDSHFMERRLLYTVCSELSRLGDKVKKNDKIRVALIKLAGYKSRWFHAQPIFKLEKIYRDKDTLEGLLKKTVDPRKRKLLERCLQRLK